jgi:hypothetical protein
MKPFSAPDCRESGLPAHRLRLEFCRSASWLQIPAELICRSHPVIVESWLVWCWRLSSTSGKPFFSTSEISVEISATNTPSQLRLFPGEPGDKRQCAPARRFAQSGKEAKLRLTEAAQRYFRLVLAAAFARSLSANVTTCSMSSWGAGLPVQISNWRAA